MTASLLVGRRLSVSRFLVAGFAALRLPQDRFLSLRRLPGPVFRDPISPALIKHADQQTVAGLAAVLQAIHDHGLGDQDFTEWGVIAGPSLLGRQATTDSLARFREEGAFAISPHLIPHESLHAISGTVSQVLRIHGPNFGVGGGPSSVAETLLVAASLLVQPTLPGLWVVLTDYETEFIPRLPDRGVAAAEGPACLAVALALVPAPERKIGLPADSLGFQICPSGSKLSDGKELPHLSLKTLADYLGQPEHLTENSWRLGSDGWLSVAGTAVQEDFCE